MKIQSCMIGMMVLGLGASAFGQGAPEEQKKSTWESSAALGLTLTEGNSRTLQINGQVQSMKKWDQNELNLGASGTYGKDRGEKSAESLRGYAQYNRLFSERVFGYLRGTRCMTPSRISSIASASARAPLLFHQDETNPPSRRGRSGRHLRKARRRHGYLHDAAFRRALRS